MFQCNTHILLDTQILCIARNPFKMCSTLSNFSMYSLTSSLCCLFRSDLKKIKVFQLTNKLAAPLSCFAPLACKRRYERWEVKDGDALHVFSVEERRCFAFQYLV